MPKLNSSPWGIAWPAYGTITFPSYSTTPFLKDTSIKRKTGISYGIMRPHKRCLEMIEDGSTAFVHVNDYHSYSRTYGNRRMFFCATPQKLKGKFYFTVHLLLKYSNSDCSIGFFD
eukprot:UN23615